MRINRYIASATGVSRRSADQFIKAGKVLVSGQRAKLGQDVANSDDVTLNGKLLNQSQDIVTIMLNKPVGYVCSRDGQGSKTVYELLPEKHQHLKPIGRLDKDSSGLLLLTNDGVLAQKLSHPSFSKKKVYEVVLDKSLSESDKKQIEAGVMLEDGISKFTVMGNGKEWTASLTEGRNRQIRRTFDELGYRILKLHRNQIDSHRIRSMNAGDYRVV